MPALHHHVLGCWGGCWDLGEIPAEVRRKVGQGLPHSWVHKGFSLQAKKGLSPSVDADGNRGLFSETVKPFIFLPTLLPLTASILTQ